MNRYDFVYLFDVTDGNPNGDPDAGNLPRVDPETGHGLVTDVCLKRKIRNFVGIVHGEKPPYEIYVKERAVLNAQHDRAWQEVDPKATKDTKKKYPRDQAKARALTKFMCDNFYDIRAFGAVMGTEVNCGQVRGPVQFGFARSIDPIVALEHSITRCAVTKESDFERKDREMGRKFTVPYALYYVYGFVNPFLADGDKGTGFSDGDLELLKRALAEMFEHDRSAARGQMAPRACIAFRHESPLGNAQAADLFKRVDCRPKPEVAQGERPPRCFDDYALSVDESALPAGVTVERWV
jgi:CRISPR-associated protein Csd2